jgi:repressor LexA
MRPAEIEELKDIFKALEEKGWQPMLCDTPVPFFDNPVSCGSPTDVGDILQDTTMLPKEFLSMQPEFVVKVMGESMKDAGIMEGDSVKVVTSTRFHDGDIVLVMVDGEITLKCYCEDEDGIPWLVPQNADYDAFPLN